MFQSKIKGKEEPLKGAGAITDEVIDNVDELYDFLAPLPDFENITKAVRRYRQKFKPKQPKDLLFQVSFFSLIAPKSKLNSDTHVP